MDREELLAEVTEVIAARETGEMDRTGRRTEATAVEILALVATAIADQLEKDGDEFRERAARSSVPNAATLAGMSVAFHAAADLVRGLIPEGKR